MLNGCNKYLDFYLKNILYWTFLRKSAIILTLCFLIFFLGLVINIFPILKKTNQLKKVELNLINEIDSKNKKIDLLNKDNKKVNALKKDLDIFFKKMLIKKEIPIFIENILEKGADQGLRFHLIKPMESIKHDFYTELPIRIIVQGNYNQIINFIEEVSHMDPIVNFGDFNFSTVNSKQHFLQMEIVLKTYCCYGKIMDSFEKMKKDNQ